jgi:Domain of unknown function (DUF1963)
MDQIELKLKKQKKLGIAASKIGGRPSLPAKFSWPTGELSEGALGFVLQLNLAELQKAVPTKHLPAKGLLQLFCSLDESDLSSPEPEHAICFHGDVGKLVDTDLPEELDLEEANLEQRAIAFGAKSGEARMFGDAPELGSNLEGIFDPKKEALLLELDAYGNVTRVGDNHSIFGEGRFVLAITKTDLAKGALAKASLLFVGGT